MSNTKIKLFSQEQEAEEFKNFSMLKRRIRKWLTDNDKQTLEIYNLFQGIYNVFEDVYIIEIANSKFNIDERAVIFALMKKFNPESVKTERYNKIFYLGFMAKIKG